MKIQWPDENQERLNAARGRLEVAREILLNRGTQSVLAVLAQVLDDWQQAGSPWRARLAQELDGAGGFPADLTRAGLKLGLETWSGDALRETIEREQSALLSGSGRRWVSFSSTHIVLAGAIPMPSLLQPILSLACLSPVLVKPSSRDPITAPLLAESIRAVDEEIGTALEVVSFPSHDDAGLNLFLEAPCIVASGHDATIRSLATRLQSTARLVPYGHRLSIEVIDSESLTDDVSGLAQDIAFDVVLWDQQGCLSPAGLYVVGPGAAEGVARLGPAIAAALEDLGETLPPGAVETEAATQIVHERDQATLRSAAGDPPAVLAGANTSWTVVLEGDSTWRPCPGHRFLRLYPVEETRELENALAPIGPHLSSAALVALPERRAAFADRLLALGATRICRPGRMQAPPLDWPHDGQSLLAPLVRITQQEPDPAL
ncbi:MAG: hypothetical protein CBC48_01410 [bacterium TMED88]|nr:hypothetical protein [Deltaproteobacteria bacterium]OUV36823.1 MAG: hypothetical protein CBC48_01410 [bacterium TMED88]